MLEILKHKRREVAAAREARPLAALEQAAAALPSTRDFAAALEHQSKGLKVIAELKQASPSRGLIQKDFNLEGQAKSYTAAGAAAISVLTDERFFRGRPEYLTRVRRVTTLPLLRKDFIIEPYQIYEARILGADAILLIVAALEQAELEEYLALAGYLGLAALVEVHTAPELERALQAGARIVGINNRDLKTFRVDLQTTARLRPRIPPGIIVVSESGIKNRADAAMVASAGVDAILVGEALMTAGDVAAKMAELSMAGGDKKW
ncbi:indole-3-glycerol phosphate synthase TrpC [Moorella naiadis]|uniref:indole-3-glycerol phosphate synthase TrpC n=1 Tax=Moorella naiadis (nom. illeg.) TaxID=3093670 RepID=UPI003D9C8BB8